MRSFPLVASAGRAAAAGLLLLPSIASADIGSVGAVNRQMTGTPPVSEPTLLLIGDVLVQDELVETTETGSGQLLFLDQTTLTVAPNSYIVLDRYIFDPERQTGDIAISVAKGALRFIGGQITKTNAAELNTPMASVGVRGGMALTEVADDGVGVTKVTNLASSYVIVSQNCDDDQDGFDDGARCEGEPRSSVTLSRPGATAVAGPDGVRYTGIATEDDLAEIYSALEGVGLGGLQRPLNTIRIVDGSRQVAPYNSGVLGGAYGQPQSTTGESLVGNTFDFPDPNDVNQGFNTIAEQIESGEVFPPPEEPSNRPDPSVIAALTGTATYSGGATGLQSFVNGQPDQAVNGTFDMIYDFGDRAGAIDFNMLDTTFTVDVAAEPNNAADYSGTDPIFGGPDSITATGGFYTGPNDPRASVKGGFDVDLPSFGSSVTGDYEGPRTD